MQVVCDGCQRAIPFGERITVFAHGDAKTILDQDGRRVHVITTVDHVAVRCKACSDEAKQ